jgi:NADH dehydrogenase
MLLLVGGTGDLGGRVARRLARQGIAIRALVRPGADAAALRDLGAEIADGDLRDPASLDRAVAGCSGVVTTATAMGRAMRGEPLSVHDVDGRGMQHLIQAAENAGVERFTYVSSAGIDHPVAAACPLGMGKRAAEARLRASRMREVVIRPDMFMEVWFSAPVGFDWRQGAVTVFGRGDAPAAYVASDDVAELTVRLTVAADPPPVVEFGGPEAVSRNGAVAAFERATGRRFRVRHVPRIALRAGGWLLSSARPHLASAMSLSLVADVEATPRRADALRSAGIDPLPVSRYVADVTRGGG